MLVLVWWFAAAFLRVSRDRNPDERPPYKKTWRNQSLVITVRLSNEKGERGSRDLFPTNQGGRLSCH